MAHYNGTSGDVTIGATALKVTKWSATEKVEVLPITHKGSGGYQEIISGVHSCDISVEGNWDSAIHGGDPPKFYAGLTATHSLELWDGGPTLSGSFMISTVNYESAVDGVVSYSYDATSNGGYALPGASGS